METAKLDGFVGSLQWTLHVAVFPTAVRLQSQTAVTPTVVAACETGAASGSVRSTEPPESQRYRDLAKQLGRIMLAALRQQIVSRGLT